MQDILDVNSASQESVDAGSLRDSFTEALGQLVMNRLDIQLLSRKGCLIGNFSVKLLI